MRPWIKPFALGIFTSAALLGGLAAFATGTVPVAMAMASAHLHGDAQGDHLATFRAMISSKLDLDAAQNGKLDALLAQVRTQHAALHGSTDPHTALAGLMQGNAFDRSTAQQLLDGKLQVVQSGGPQMIAALADFYDGLRPDQQQKVRDFMAAHHGHHEHGGHASH